MLLFVFIFSSAFTCNKENEQEFCNRNREVADTLVDRTGTIYYNDPYKRWAINIDSSVASIDNSYIGIPCSFTSDFQKEGTKVKFSGVLKKLNEDEIIQPKISTQELFYLEITSISKK
mgnify:CR=1 FL=1